MDVVTVGEALIGLDSCGHRLLSARTLEKSVGGAESNTAIGLARLGHQVGFIGRIGDDPLGDEVERTLRAEGVDISYLDRDTTRSTALMLKERRNGNAVTVHYHRAGSAGAALNADDLPVDAIVNARLLHATGVTLALGDGPRKAAHRAMLVARDAAVPVSLDANFRYKLGTPTELVEQFEAVVELADHVLLSWNDAATCAGSRDPALVRKYAGSLSRPFTVLKGPRGGATALQDGEVVAEVPPYPTEIVDPVGAGDGFAVGYLHGVLRGQPVNARLALGAWISAQVVAQAGDYAGLPFRAELAARTDEVESAVTR